MKKLLLGMFVLFTSASFAQDNTIPTTGNVGIGTLTPSAKLDVNGNMIVDSCLIIKDTLIVEDDARILNDMKVDGDTKLGNVSIQGDLSMPNIGTTTDEDGVLRIDSLGNTFKTPYEDFALKMVDAMYNTEVPLPPNTTKCDAQAYTDNPFWQNDPFELFVACPNINVGIGTSDPESQLHIVSELNSLTPGVIFRIDNGDIDEKRMLQLNK